MGREYHFFSGIMYMSCWELSGNLVISWSVNLLFWGVQNKSKVEDITFERVMPVTTFRTFALIVSAHPYCARKFTCHVMHRARATGRSVTPTFLFENIFYLQLSTLWPKINKKSMWEGKIHDFCPRDIKTCHNAGARRVKLLWLNENLLFKEPRQLTKFA